MERQNVALRCQQTFENKIFVDNAQQSLVLKLFPPVVYLGVSRTT